MKLATVIILAYLGLLGFGYWLVRDFSILVVGLLLFPSFMQAVPFGLDLQQHNTDAVGSSMGFVDTNDDD